MSKLKDINELFPSVFEEDSDHGDSKHCNINRNGYFYHVTQQCWNHRNFYSFDAARYRDSLIKSTCKTHNVLLVMNVIMPNHTHEVFYSPDFSNIQAVIQIVNSKTSHFISNERRNIYGKETAKVFQFRPVYTPILNRNQFFYLIYYLYHNYDFLREANKDVPLSCFEMWKQKNAKEYYLQVFDKLFDLNIYEILKYCSELNKEEYQKLGNKLFKRFEESDKQLFSKN